MKGLFKIMSAVSTVVFLSGCCIKENRIPCPTNLSLDIHRQPDSVFCGGKAWCSLFDEDKSLPFVSTPLDGMNAGDTTVMYRIKPKRNVCAVVSNADCADGYVSAGREGLMPCLYAWRKDFVCFSEYVAGKMDRQDKQFCRLTVRLVGDARDICDELTAIVEGPYDGTEFPSLCAHRGDFSRVETFGTDARARFIIPRQGGEGLELTLTKPGFSGKYDLYGIFLTSEYDWDAASLNDFEILVGLDGVTGGLAVEDWSEVLLGDTDF